MASRPLVSQNLVSFFLLFSDSSMSGVVVVIVGCGNLGFRHFEGVFRSLDRVTIHLLDQNERAIEGIQNRVNQNFRSASQNQIFYWSNFESFIAAVTKIDITIVATTAFGRGELLAKLFESLDSNFWVLEKPLVTDLDGFNLIRCTAPENGVWVNYPRRICDWHISIKRLLEFKNQQMRVAVSSKNIGIACNATHFIDLVNFWTAEYPVKVDLSGLQPTWVRSKREGFFEVEGTLVINLSKGSVLQISTSSDFDEMQIELTDTCNDFICKIDETQNIAQFSDNTVINGNLPFQSSLTELIVKRITEGKDCGLTTLSTALECNLKLVASLEQHWMNYGPTGYSRKPLYT